MRITFLLPVPVPSGGIRVVFKLADELAKRGHDVTLYASRNEHLPQAYKTRARVRFATDTASWPASSLGNLYSYSTQLRRLPQSDVLIATYYPTAYVACLARLLHKHAGKTVYFVQGIEPTFCQGLLRPIKSMTARWSYRLPVEMVTNSMWTANSIHRIGGRNAQVIGLGIDLDVFHPPACERESKTERGLIMTIGRNQRIKGYDQFIEAMRIVKTMIPQLRLLVVSQEDMWIPPDLEGEVIRPESDSELVACYHRAQVYVSTSWYEGFGLPGLEAMACGTPLVTTDSGGVIEYAKHDENCLVCPPRDIDALARAVLTMLQDGAMRQQFMREGVRTAREFSWENVADKLERVLVT